MEGLDGMRGSPDAVIQGARPIAGKPAAVIQGVCLRSAWRHRAGVSVQRERREGSFVTG